MKGYRKKTRTAPRKNVKNKFVVTYDGFKTPTQNGKEPQTKEQKQENDDHQRTNLRSAIEARSGVPDVG